MGIFTGWGSSAKARETAERARYAAKMEDYQRQAAQASYDMHMSLQAKQARRASRPEGLDHYRLSDLAGFLGRVEELLTFAAAVAAPYEEDPEKTRKHAMAARFSAGAAKARAVQMDLIQMADEIRVNAEASEVDRALHENARAVQNDMERRAFNEFMAAPQWSADEIERYRKDKASPIVVNRICPICDDKGGLDAPCPECGRAPLSDPFQDQKS